MLRLMYITNDVEVARVAEKNGVDIIFVDMEYIGKGLRQGGMDTVQNHHTIEDVKRIRKATRKTELLVRCNPVHEQTESYCSTKEEIDAIIEAGADIIMLPYFKTVDEVEYFLGCVDRRVKTMLLFETPESADLADEILALDGIDEFFIGLNDLSLGYGKKFMFELLADGTVEDLCSKFRAKGVPYGFGGIASLGKGMLPAEQIVAEHYRLGSSGAILSRSFCGEYRNASKKIFCEKFGEELIKIREYEGFCGTQDKEFFIDNSEAVRIAVSKILDSFSLVGEG